LLQFRGQSPQNVLLIGAIPQSLEAGLLMSPQITAAIPRAELEVIKELQRLDHSPQRCWRRPWPGVSAHFSPALDPHSA
jgi:hypothetical protein